MLGLITYLHYWPVRSHVANMGNIIPFWNLHFVLKMLVQSPRLDWPFATSWLMAYSISSTLASSTGSAWFRF
jgi:hypothetical protein